MTSSCAAAEDKKAEDIVVLDLVGRTIVADAFVVMTGRSNVQTRSIADGIAEEVRDAGFAVARTEGYADGGWILIDLGPIVVHVFTPGAAGVLQPRAPVGLGPGRRAGPDRRMSPKLETRAARSLRQTLIKAGIWIFLVLFVFSVVGVAVVTVRPR